MPLDHHQTRLLNHMVLLIEEFTDGSLPFVRLVGELHGALDAAELKDEGFVKRWYALWTRLETKAALRGDAVEFHEVETDLAALSGLVRAFLQAAAKEES